MTALIPNNFVRQNKRSFEPEWDRDHVGDRMQGVGDTTGPHDPYKGTDGWMKYFGVPRAPIWHQPEDSFDRENYQLPDAYRGSNSYISRLIIRKIQQTERFPTTVMFPLQEHSNSMSVAWDSFTFGDHLMDRVPEEGVPRMLSFKKTSDRATLHRLAKGMILEHGFMKTPQGRMHWAANIMQITNAAEQTMEYNALFAAAHWPLFEDVNDMYRNSDARSGQELYRLFQEELNLFGCIQKSYDGLDTVVSRIQTLLKKRGGGPGNVWAFPEGIRMYTDNTDREKYFWMSGKALDTDYSHLDHVMKGMNWWESQPIVIGENQVNQDVLVRPQTIGNFFVMNDQPYVSVKPEEYGTHMQDTRIYNEDSDDFEIIRLKDTWQHLGLFHVDDPEDDMYYPLTTIGQEFFASSGTWGKFLRGQGRLSSFVDSLYAKDKETIDDFYDVVVRQVNNRKRLGGGGGGGGEETEDKPVQRQWNLGSLFSVRAFNAAEASSKLASFFPRAEPGQVSNVVQFLHSVDQRDEQMNVLQTYFEHLETVKPTTSLYSDLWNRVSWTLLGADVDIAVKTLKSQYANLTPFEESYTPAAQGAKGNDIGPRWKSMGDATPERRTLRVFINPALDADSTNSLFYSASAYTLTTTHVVAFALNEEELHFLEANRGQVNIDFSDVPAGAPVRSDKYRSALFQFSVALSAIFSQIVAPLRSKYVRNEALTLSAEELNKICQRAMAMVNVLHTSTGNVYEMAHAARTAKSLPLLYSQRFAKRAIESIRDILCDLYTQKAPAAWAKQVVRIANEIAETMTIPELPLEQSATGSRMGGFIDSTLEHKEASSDYRPRSANVKKGGEKMEQLRAVRKAKEPTIHDSLQDSFKTFEAPYAELYALFHEAKLDDPYWEQAVHLGDRLFSDRIEGVKATRSLTNAYLYDLRKRMKKELTSGNSAAEIKEEFEPKKSGEERVAMDRKIVSRLQEASALRFNESSSSEVLRYRKDAKSGNKRTDGWATIRRIFDLFEKLKAKGKAYPDLHLYSSPSRAQIAFTTGLSTYNTWSKPDFKVDRNTSDQVKFLITLRQIANGASAQSADEYLTLLDIDAADLTGLQQQEDALEEEGGITNPKITKAQLIATVDQLQIEDSSFLQWCLNNNVYHGVGGIGFRPHVTYRMASAIHMIGGVNGAGRTLYAHPDFQVADNVAQKMHYGHLSFYSKTVVFSPEKVAHARNILCRQYMNGNGTRFFNHNDEDDVADYISNNALTRDIFFLPIPAAWKTSLYLLDITGRFHPSLGADADAQKQTQYPSCRIMKDKWEWKHCADPLDRTWDNSFSGQARFNTLCFQGTQLLYNHATKDYTTRIFNRGHWGPNEYPGCGKIRNGYGKFLETVHDGNTNVITVRASSA
jgi:hypothetical protein